MNNYTSIRNLNFTQRALFSKMRRIGYAGTAINSKYNVKLRILRYKVTEQGDQEKEKVEDEDALAENVIAWKQCWPMKQTQAADNKNNTKAEKPMSDKPCLFLIKPKQKIPKK